ncbi:PIG-L deacetylase family protein [Alteriqipengyuania sp. 357]
MSVPDKPEGALLDAAATAPAIQIEALAPPGGLLIVSPHPDDETLGCGMALASAAAAGRRIAILLLTDGENSHPHSRRYPRAKLIAIRREELQTALHSLAPGHDTTVERAQLTDGNSTAEAGRPEFIQYTCNFARSMAPAAVWSTWEGDPHCDHQAAAHIARAIAKDLDIPSWSFAVWGRFGNGEVPSAIRTFRNDRFLTAKGQAMAAYRSQLTNLIDDDPQGFAMPLALAEHFRSHAEIFIRE